MLNNVNRRVLVVGIDQAVLSAGSFVITLLLIRLLEIEQFGKFVIFQSILMLMMAIHGALIISPLSVSVPKMDKPEAIRYVSQLTFGQIALNLLISLALVIIATLFKVFGFFLDYVNGIYLVSIASFFYLQYLFFRSVLLARIKVVLALIGDIVFVVVQLILIYALYKNTLLTDFSAILIISMAALSAVLLKVFCLKEYFSRKKESVWFGLKSSFNQGRWLFGAAFIGWIRTNGINYVSLYFLGPLAPAVLKALQTLFGPINMLLVGLESLVPQFLSMQLVQANGFEKFKKSFRLVTFLIIFVTIIYCLLVSIGASHLVGYLYSADYIEYSGLVWVLALQYVLISSQTMIAIGLRCLELAKSIFKVSATEAIITLLPGLFLIAYWGIEGAVLWKLLSSLFVAVFSIYVFRKAYERNDTAGVKL